MNRAFLSEGPNDFMKVRNVVNSDGETVPSPKFMKVYAGAGAPGDSRDMHSVIIDTRGNVYTTGNNAKGQLCLGDFESRDTFHQVTGLPFRAVAAAVGIDFTQILLADGKVFGCGSNENGELGLGRNINGTTTPDNRNGLTDIIDVSAGLSFSLYLSRTGNVLGSGSNLFGQMCEDTGGNTVDVPKVRWSPVLIEDILHFTCPSNQTISSPIPQHNRNSLSLTSHLSRLDTNRRTSSKRKEKSSPVVVMMRDNLATVLEKILLNQSLLIYPKTSK